MSILVFDIETIPDVQAARKTHDFGTLSDAEVADALFAQRRAKVSHEFLPHYMQKVAAISLVLHQGETIKCWSLGDESADEKDIITRFFTGLEKHTPTLVSWNGAGFDLPVLHFRALFNGVQAPAYWEYGENQSSFKWNNYLNRYHYRHLDLMDVISGYQSKAFAPLDDIATILGFPGKMGMSGDKVWGAYLNGEIKAIRDYCETDVLNTFCVYLRFEFMRGNLNQSSYEHKLQMVKDYLKSESDKPHFQQFLGNM